MKFRRLIPRLLLCLALGLVTTIAIAWTSAAFGTAGWAGAGMEGPDPAQLGKRFWVNRDFGRAGERVKWTLFPGGPHSKSMNPDLADARTALPLFQHSGFFPRWWGRAPSIPIDTLNLEYSPEWIQDARGWPVVAVWCEWYEPGRWTDADFQLGPRAAGGIDLPMLPPRSIRALPYRPIPIGLLADTLLFALAWSLLLYAPRPIRRAIRAYRNLCSECAYSREGLAPDSPCPECGHTPPPPTDPRP